MTTAPAVAVLGLGSIGIRHARNLLALHQRVVGYDPSDAKRDALVADGGMAAGSLQSALDKATAAVIASPSRCHLEQAGMALERGCHMFIEKPLAHTDEGCPELLSAADRAGVVVFAGLNQRYNPVVLAARDVLRSGTVGDPLWARFICASYLPGWRPDQDYRTGYAADPRTGGVLFDIIHEFDIANFLLGPGETIAAFAHTTGHLELTSEDCADVTIQHGAGVRSTLHLDYVTRPRRRGFEIACTSGLLEADIAERCLLVHGADGTVLSRQQWDGSAADDYRAEMAHFLACTKGAERPACDGEEALAVLRQVLKARELCGLPKP